MIPIKFFIATGFVGLLFQGCAPEKNSKESNRIPSAIPVKIFRLQPAEAAVSISCTGTLFTENQAQLAFKSGGVIDKILVREGDSFSKGQLLAQLNTTEIEAGLNQAKLAQEKAARELQRVSNLLRDSVTTLEQWQDAQTMLQLASEQVNALQFNKKFAFIYAPKAGFVVQKMANVGEITAGGSPILSIAETGKESWVLKVGLSDQDWTNVEIGNPASVTLDAYPHQLLTGKVIRKSKSSDPSSGTFLVEIRINSSQIVPAQGMFGRAEIQTNVRKTYQSIPYEALIEADGSTAYVFVPAGNGRVKKQSILIGEFDQHQVKVLSGLNNITEIIIGNAAFLNSQSTIRIIKQ